MSDGPDSPIRVAMEKGDPGSSGHVFVVHHHDSPFSVTRTKGDSPEIYLIAKPKQLQVDPDTGVVSLDGAAIRITEAVARQLVEDLTRALESPEGFYVSHEADEG